MKKRWSILFILMIAGGKLMGTASENLTAQEDTPAARNMPKKIIQDKTENAQRGRPLYRML